MIAAQIFSELRQLDRADKLRVLQFLAVELAKDEGALLSPNAEYPVWSPYAAYEAANTLLELLQRDTSQAYG